MALIRSGYASVVVEDPPATLLEGLRRFRRDEDGRGEYENLYSLSFDGKTLVTAPGFVKRVMELCPGGRFRNERRPMPKPNKEAATSGLDKFWEGIVANAVDSCGGIVCIPEALGDIDMAAAILRAFPHEALLERGLPMSVVAVPDDEMARAVVSKLQAAFPNRDIGHVNARRYSDADDILVTTYGNLKNLSFQPVGVFIACGLSGTDVTPYVESISTIRNAARWGIFSTPLGDVPDEDMTLEGLFGEVVAAAKYSDAVKAGAMVPVTVCWLPAPEPSMLGRGPFELIEANAMQNNPRFCDLVADIVRNVPSDIGVIVNTNKRAMADSLTKRVKGLVTYDRQVPPAQRRAIRNDIMDGVIRRAVASFDVPLLSSHGVMILASCEGRSVAAKRVPWRKKVGPRDRAFIIDFGHSWDMHNGRPGYLARNDNAREMRYQELGFRQMSLDSVNQLPFIGG